MPSFALGMSFMTEKRFIFRCRKYTPGVQNIRFLYPLQVDSDRKLTPSLQVLFVAQLRELKACNSSTSSLSH